MFGKFFSCESAVIQAQTFGTMKYLPGSTSHLRLVGKVFTVMRKLGSRLNESLVVSVPLSVRIALSATFC